MNLQIFLCHEIGNEGSGLSDFSQCTCRCLETDCYFESLIPFATEKPRRPDPRSNIEQLIVTIRSEALPNFCDKATAIIVAH